MNVFIVTNPEHVPEHGGGSTVPVPNQRLGYFTSLEDALNSLGANDRSTVWEIKPNSGIREQDHWIRQALNKAEE